MMVLFTGQKGALRQCFSIQDIMCQMTVVLSIVYLLCLNNTFLPLKKPLPLTKHGTLGMYLYLSLVIFWQTFFYHH